MKLTHGNLSSLEFSPTQDPAGGWPIVFWSMDRQSSSSQLTHSSLAHENVYHLCDNYMKKNMHAYMRREFGLLINYCGRIQKQILYIFNTLRPRQNGRQCPDDIFNCIFLVKIMAWRRPGDSHYVNHRWLVYRRIYMPFGPNELMSMFAKTLISPTSLSDGKFLGRAIPIIVPFTMFENLFQDWDTVLKNVLFFSRKSTIWSNLSGTKKTVTALHHAIIFFFNKMAWLVAWCR